MIAEPPTLRERLSEHASRFPDVAALEADGVRIPYGALPGEVTSLARAIAARGIARGEVVALAIDDEVDHVLATLALFELGIANLALDTRDPPALRMRLAGRIGVTSILADDPDGGVEGARTVDFAALRAASRPARAGAPFPIADPHEPALVLTGSGTTGDPKIVRFSQLDLALHSMRSFDFAGQRALRPAHVSYNNSKRLRLYTLWQGGTCVLANGSRSSVHQLCARHRVTRLEGSPIHAADLVTASRDEGRLPEETVMRVGGSRVPIALRRAFMAQVTPHLHVSYGTTEVALVAIADPTMHDARETVGLPVPGMSVEVVRGDGSPAEPGEIGEIRLRAAGMADRYYGEPSTTARHFRDGWFMPGDLASLDRDGKLYIHGRSDDMMILNGINIFPTEIERVLECHPAVLAAAAFPIASGVHGQIPMAAVELHPGSACTVSELADYARAELGVRAPRRIEILASLPRNAQGKVVRRRIVDAFGGPGVA